jgi:hypothetical protein
MKTIRTRGPVLGGEVTMEPEYLDGRGRRWARIEFTTVNHKVTGELQLLTKEQEEALGKLHAQLDGTNHAQVLEAVKNVLEGTAWEGFIEHGSITLSIRADVLEDADDGVESGWLHALSREDPF